MMPCLKYIFPLFLLSILRICFAEAQVKTQRKGQKEAIRELNAVVAKPGAIDSASLFDRIKTIQLHAVSEGDKAIFLDAELIKAFYYFMQNRKENTSRISEILEAVKDDANKNKIDYIVARVEERYGQMYCWLNNNERAFDHWQKQLAISYKLSNPDDGGISGLIPTLYHFADIYYFYGEYRNSINYFHQLLPRLTNTKENVYYLLQANNTLGISYQKIGMLDSADYYLKRCRDYAKAYNRPEWEGIANDGIGTNFFLRGEYPKAVPLLQQNVVLARQRRDWWSACGSLMVLADISLRSNDIATAETQLNEARRYAHTSMSMRNTKLPLLYPLLAKLYTAKGNTVIAKQYIDSTVIVKDSMARQVAEVQLMRMNQREEILHQKTLLDDTINEKNAKVQERNLLIALAGTLALLSVCFFLFQQKKHQQEQQMKEFRIEQQEQELARASEQLNELVHSIAQNNELAVSLHKRFNTVSDYDAIATLQKSYIRDWDKFTLLFEQVHAGYLHELNRKLPGITPSEMRFMTLAKLNLNNKQMASALGVSPESMRVTWHRLRRKLNLPNTTTIAELVGSIR